jgi:hypothetical protein
MSQRGQGAKSFFNIETKPRKPLITFNPPKKQKPLLNNFMKKDEDLDFIMDSYQSGLSPFFVCDAECKARSAVLRKIARKRHPKVIPIFDQIERIISENKKGNIDINTARKKLIEISERHGHPDLHRGILAKIGMIASQGRPQKQLGIFAMQTNSKPHPIAVFISNAKKEQMKVVVKSRKVMGDYIALHGKMGQIELPVHLRNKIPKNQIWIRKDVYDNPVRRKRILEGHEQFEINLMVENHMPYRKAHKLATKNERIENPMAKFFNSNATKGRKNGKEWDPWHDEHPLATMMKQQNKKRRKK